MAPDPASGMGLDVTGDNRDIVPHVAILATVAQQVIDQNQRHHGLGDGSGANTDTGVMPPLGDHFHRFTGNIDAATGQMQAGGGFQCQVSDQLLPGGNSTEDATGLVVIRFNKDISFIHEPALVRLLRELADGTKVRIDATAAGFIDFDLKEKIQDFVESAPARSLEVELVGITLDHQAGLTGRGFVFHHPMASNTCGCGESFSL